MTRPELMAFRCINAYKISDRFVRKALLKPSFTKYYVIMTSYDRSFGIFPETHSTPTIL